jgi:hypothetical protein
MALWDEFTNPALLGRPTDTLLGDSSSSSDISLRVRGRSDVPFVAWLFDLEASEGFMETAALCSGAEVRAACRDNEAISDQASAGALRGRIIHR